MSCNENGPENTDLLCRCQVGKLDAAGAFSMADVSEFVVASADDACDHNLAWTLCDWEALGPDPAVEWVSGVPGQ